MLLVVLSGVWEEGRLSAMMELVEKSLSWILKFCLGTVTGLGVLQSMVAPALDAWKRTAAQKAIAQEINKMAKADVETQVYTEFNEQFQAVAWIILLLLLAEMLILERKNPLFRNIHLFKKEERYDDEK